jgi:hypothetical protein
MSDYDITKLINTVNKQSQIIEVLIRKADDLTKAMDRVTATLDSMARDMAEGSHGH